MRIVKAAAGIALILSLSSCLGIDAGLVLNDNGSGKLAFQYRLAKVFVGPADHASDTGAPGIPLPASRQDLEKTLARVKGVALTAIEQTETDADIVLKGEIRFDTIAALNKSGLFDEMPVSLGRTGAQTVFTQVISGPREPLDKQTLETYRKLWDGYEMVFRFIVPRPIASAAPARSTLSDDKRTLTYKISLTDYMQLTDKTIVEITW
jgi:hypothetical protein